MSSHNSGPVGSPPQLANGAIVPLSPAYATEGLVFASGQLALDARGRLVDGAMAEQASQCLANMERVLAQTGLTRNQVVKTTVWLTDLADFAAFNAAYAAFFGEHRPARSTVRADLLLPGALVEIEAIAVRTPGTESDGEEVT